MHYIVFAVLLIFFSKVLFFVSSDVIFWGVKKENPSQTFVCDGFSSLGTLNRLFIGYFLTSL